MNLGEKIKKIRNERGFSLRDLASQVDLSASFLSQIEQGKASPSIENLKKIANSLDVKVSYLIEDEEIKKDTVLIRRNERDSIERYRDWETFPLYPPPNLFLMFYP